MASDEASILDALIQAMFDHRILPVDARGQLIILPDEHTCMPGFWWVQHKTQAGIVAFVLQACESSPSALEADTFGLSQTDTIEGMIGTTGQGLREHGIQMLSEPADACLFGVGMQRVLREA